MDDGGLSEGGRRDRDGLSQGGRRDEDGLSQEGANGSRWDRSDVVHGSQGRDRGGDVDCQGPVPAGEVTALRLTVPRPSFAGGPARQGSRSRPATGYGHVPCRPGASRVRELTCAHVEPESWRRIRARAVGCCLPGNRGMHPGDPVLHAERAAGHRIRRTDGRHREHAGFLVSIARTRSTVRSSEGFNGLRWFPSTMRGTCAGTLTLSY